MMRFCDRLSSKRLKTLMAEGVIEIRADRLYARAYAQQCLYRH